MDAIINIILAIALSIGTQIGVGAALKQKPPAVTKPAPPETVAPATDETPVPEEKKDAK